jgi:hypothetical protein
MKTISIPRYRVLQNVDNDLKAGLAVGTWNSFDTTTFQLVADNSDFTNVQAGDIVFNPENSSTWAEVVTVDSATELTLNGVFSTTIIGGATELKRFSVVAPAVAFQVATSDVDTAQEWWSTYEVGDRIQSQGQQSRTLANQAVGTILDITIDLDGPNPGATLTVDMPMQTSNEIWVYKDDITTIPVNEISGIEFYKYFQSALGEITAYLYIGNGEYYRIEPQVFEFKNREDVLTYQPKFEAAIMNAISETLRSPWPDSNVVIEGSHGWQVRLED